MLGWAHGAASLSMKSNEQVSDSRITASLPQRNEDLEKSCGRWVRSQDGVRQWTVSVPRDCTTKSSGNDESYYTEKTWRAWTRGVKKRRLLKAMCDAERRAGVHWQQVREDGRAPGAPC